MGRTPLFAAILALTAAAALGGAARPDLGSVSPTDRRLIERACDVEPGADHEACVERGLAELKQVKIPDLAALAPPERQLLEKACGLEHELEGPATYYACANRFLAVLHESFGDLESTERAAHSQGGPPRSHRTDAGSTIPPHRAAHLAGQAQRPARRAPPATLPQSAAGLPAGEALLVLFGVVGVASVAAVLLVRFHRETCDDCGSAGKVSDLGLCGACARKQEGSQRTGLRRRRL